MPLQQTPPPGWPHTEAEKYRDRSRPEVPQYEVAPPGHTAPEPVREAGRGMRTGCGCAVSLLTLLAIAGALIALFVPLWSEESVELGSSPEEMAAEETFLASYPDWQVEVVDRPDNDPDAVRIVAWDYGRSIGRIAFVDPSGDTDTGYYLNPIIPGDSVAADEAILDAFAESWSDTRWAYIRFAEPDLDAGDAAAWLVSYRVWDDATVEWTEVRQARALRLADDSWVVAGPDGSMPDVTTNETTETP